jgi:hypothetical protein
MAEIKANKISTAKATAFRVKKSRLDTDAEDFDIGGKTQNHFKNQGEDAENRSE